MLPTAEELRIDIESGRGASLWAKRIVNIVETDGMGRAAIFEEREGFESRLIAGRVSTKTISTKVDFRFPMAAITPEMVLYRATLRMVLMGALRQNRRELIESLAKDCESLCDLSDDEENSEMPEVENQNIRWGMIGTSISMQSVFAQIEKVAPFDAIVLILGETGTGKERIAQAIHQASKRKGPLETVNCGCLNSELLSAELFGHVKGSFTGAMSDKMGVFERANGGTVFLDEIGEMPVEHQVALLRVLEEGKIRPIGGTEKKVDVRVIAATHRNLEEMVSEGKFRQDLYYRLKGATITVTPLRERKDDIMPIATSALKSICSKKNFSIVFSDAAVTTLLNYDFPGNIRELVRTVESAVINAQDGVILPEHLQLIVNQFTKPGRDAPSDDYFNSFQCSPVTHNEFKELVKNVELDLYLRTFSTCESFRDAAICLQMSERTLRRRCDDLGVIPLIVRARIPSIINHQEAARA